MTALTIVVALAGFFNVAALGSIARQLEIQNKLYAMMVGQAQETDTADS